MAAPYFEYKKICQDKGVEVLSSNYQLYGDMSNRVMDSFKKLIPDVEVFSNDKIGKRTVFFAAQGTKRDWQMRSNNKSPCYITNWNELLCAF